MTDVNTSLINETTQGDDFESNPWVDFHKEHPVEELRAVKGRVHSVESMGLVDGPGVRSIFFLQGCPLRCAYCHNPDTQDTQGGQEMTAGEVVDRAKRFRSYFGSEGGITFSGGEPLLQGAFLSACLRLLKQEGINTCVDTSGFGDKRYYPQIFPYVDTLLLDVKEFQSQAFYELVEARMETYLDFIHKLEVNGFRGAIWARHVMVPGRTDNEKSMDRFIRLLLPISHLIERVEILPYHVMGKEKYAELGRPYRLEGVPPMDKKRAHELQVYANQLLTMYISQMRQERRKKEVMSGKDFTQRISLTKEEREELIPHLIHIPLLRDIHELQDVDKLRHHIDFFRVPKGHFVFRTGDPADYMYIICAGHVKIYHNTPDGREQIYYIYNEGDFVGGLNVLTRENYLYMGQTLEDSLIAAISKQGFNEYMLHSPPILQRILKQSFDRIRWAEELAERLSTTNAAMKAAALLLRLKAAFGVKTPDGIRLDLSLNREEMGSYSGLTRETMTRKLGEFRDLGFIDFVGTGNRVILIKNLEALEDYCF